MRTTRITPMSRMRMRKKSPQDEDHADHADESDEDEKAHAVTDEKMKKQLEDDHAQEKFVRKFVYIIIIRKFVYTMMHRRNL
jgi:hypothetical protein